MKLNSPKAIERQIQILNKRKTAIQALQHLREKEKQFKREMKGLMREAGLRSASIGSISSPSSRETPRGVLTFALQEILRKEPKGLPVSEIIEEVKKIPELSSVSNIEQKVRTSLVAQKSHFEQKERGVYRAKSKKQLSGALFERIIDQGLVHV